MRYFYIVLTTPMGVSAKFVRTEHHHPLHPDVYARITADAGHSMTLASKTIVRPEQICIQNAIELDEDTARARFPKDFVDSSGRE